MQLMGAIEDAWSSDGRDEYRTYLPGLWPPQAPQLIWASITLCKGAQAKTHARVAQVNECARSAGEDGSSPIAVIACSC